MIYVITIFASILIGIFIYISDKVSYKKRAAAKAIASFGFIAVAIASYIFTYRSCLTFKTIFMGLLCGALGDVLLTLDRLFGTKNNEFFVLGGIAFIFGHLFYISAFIEISGVNGIDIAVALLLGIMFSVIGYRNGLRYGRLKVLAYPYTFIIAFMASKAVSLPFVNGLSDGRWLAAAGASLFLASDMILAFIDFGGRRGRKIKMMNLLTYYSGQMLIALSIMYI